MPISVDFKGSYEEMAHRAGLIPSSERTFSEQRRLFLFLTQLEYLQKMFTLVKEHCWATPRFSWLAAWSLSVIFPSTCRCTATLQHRGQTLLKLCGASVLACYQVHPPFSRTIHLLLRLLIRTQWKSPSEQSKAVLHSGFLSLRSPPFMQNWACLCSHSPKNQWKKILGPYFWTLMWKRCSSQMHTAFHLRISKRTMFLDLQHNPAILYFN